MSVGQRRGVGQDRDTANVDRDTGTGPMSLSALITALRPPAARGCDLPAGRVHRGLELRIPNRRDGGERLAPWPRAPLVLSHHRQRKMLGRHRRAATRTGPRAATWSCCHTVTNTAWAAPPRPCSCRSRPSAKISQLAKGRSSSTIGPSGGDVAPAPRRGCRQGWMRLSR